MGLLFFIYYYHESSNRESYIPSMKLFSSFNENFKLFNLLIMGRSFKSLPYFSRFSFSQRWRFWRIRANVSQGIESEITCAKVLGAFPDIFYDLQPCGTYQNIYQITEPKILFSSFSYTNQTGVQISQFSFTLQFWTKTCT